MATFTISHADTLLYGNAYEPKVTGSKRGVPTTQVVQVDLGAPAAGAANSVATSQSVGAGATFTLNGSLASGGVATFDVPRNVVAAWTTTSVLTVRGTDAYGRSITESSASGTSFAGKKAFKTITSVTSSASITLATVGTGNVLGLPYCLAGKFDILAGYADTTQEAATSTVVARDTTTATATTGDVRGTYAPATTPNGSVRFRVWMKIADVTSRAGAYGIEQYAG